MSAVGPTAGPGAGAGAAQPQPTILTLKAPGGAIARLPVGARFDALVLPGSDSRRVALHTPHGKLILATPHPLPRGASLTLELRSAGDIMRFAILAATAQAKPGGTGNPEAAQARAPVSPRTDMALSPRTDIQSGGAANPLQSAAGPAASTGGSGPLAALYAMRAGFRALIDGERVGRSGPIESGMAGIRDQAGRAEPDGWRLVAIPIVAQGENRLARLWVGPRLPDRPEAPIAIMLDMDLPATGYLRFEGALLESRFDLVLVCENPLPIGLTRGLRRIFAGTCAEVGLAGRFSVTPMSIPGPVAKSGPAPGILA